MSKQSTIARANAQGRRQRLQTQKQRGKPETNRQSLVTEPRIAVSRSHHLFVGGKKVVATIALLRRARLRHHIAAFLNGGMHLVVFTNPFSLAERKNWHELKILADQK